MAQAVNLTRLEIYQSFFIRIFYLFPVLDLRSFLIASGNIIELSSCDMLLRVCSYKNIQSLVSAPNIVMSLRITGVKIENTEFYIKTTRCVLLKNLICYTHLSL